jgi:hypothetical protein
VRVDDDLARPGCRGVEDFERQVILDRHHCAGALGTVV